MEKFSYLSLLHDAGMDGFSIDFISSKFKIDASVYNEKSNDYQLISISFEDVNHFCMDEMEVILFDDSYSIVEFEVNNGLCLFGFLDNNTNDVFQIQFNFTLCNIVNREGNMSTGAFDSFLNLNEKSDSISD